MAETLHEFATEKRAHTHTEYRTNDFFMTGESYAGVYIPTTALYLLEHQCPDFHVNLQVARDKLPRWSGITVVGL